MRNSYLSFLIKNKGRDSGVLTKRRFRKLYFVILCIFTLGIFCNSLYAHSDGSPLSCLGSGVDKYSWRFYAPGNFTCGNLGCHYQYPIGSGKGKFMLFVLDKCEPGEVVDILVSFKQTDTDFHGFQITAQDRYYNRLVGTFVNVGDDEDTQVEAEGNYATHTKKGTQQKFWHVKWQAPPADFWIANPVRFYAMGIEADNDGTAMGDYIYKATRLIIVEQKKEQKKQVRALMKE
ncbi:MAG: Reeler domain-containing protein [Candidatus Jettenia sp. CY-1]|nr:Reeler domain-containing protein [Candidatus Jettenia sp.]WKZ17723.1 MAG: Reeler domain-containing protein [Candidatus Jettenia sp. CY-1]